MANRWKLSESYSPIRIKVGSKQELVDRIHLYFEELNADPVIYRWKFRMDDTDIG